MPSKHLPASIILILCAALVFSGCGNQPPAKQAPKEELLIYCGITMVQPMRIIADLIEQQENCTVKIIKGGSGTLFRSIKVNQKGDLYLPGSESYIKKCLSEKLATDTVTVGFNRAALIVAKGNPLQISAAITNLINAKYKTVLGAPDSGSIGRESKRVLERAGIYDQAVDHALYLTEDSKRLTHAIQEKKADLIINWYATALWPEHKNSLDALVLPDFVAPPHKLVIGLLSCSTHPDLGRAFMALAASKQGQEIFSNYGFGQ